jgi:hypothetical protein
MQPPLRRNTGHGARLRLDAIAEVMHSGASDSDL